MDNRYRSRPGQHDYRDRYGSRDRQAEQYSNEDDWQQGDDSWRGQERNQRWQSSNHTDRGYGRDEHSARGGFSQGSAGSGGDTSSLDEYDRVGASRFGRGESTHHYFRADDYGGQDYSRASYGAKTPFGQARYAGGMRSADMYSRGGSNIPPRQYDRDERGFFERASDEVMSWFGDDDAARRREMDSREDHRGRGPANYTRSNERLLEDACERLTRDPHIDASKIDVSCADNEITLTGTVDSRSAKRRAEDIVDDISGVKHVQNNLRVEARESYYSHTGSATGKLSES